MTQHKVIIGLIVMLVLFAVYVDQKFEPENIDILRESAHARAEVLPPKAFTTDGCSLWLNSLFGKDFTDICIEHDIEYWKGGSAGDRKIADTILRERVNEEILLMGDIMYIGIRVFGHPLVPAPWRWGYGFEYPYTY